jgi:integrase
LEQEWCLVPPDDVKPIVTLTEFADEWMSSRIDLAVRTIELYRWLLDRHIVPTFGARPLDGITPSDVRAWHAESARKHPTTAAKAYRLLSSVMRTAVADELIRRNPCQVRGAAVERAPERPVASIAEVDALADAMPPDLYIAVMLAAWCQLRRGEVRGYDGKMSTSRARHFRSTSPGPRPCQANRSSRSPRREQVVGQWPFHRTFSIA